MRPARVDERVALEALLGEQMHERVLRRQRSGGGDFDRLRDQPGAGRRACAERRERRADQIMHARTETVA